MTEETRSGLIRIAFLLIPLLTVWWTDRRRERGEYRALASLIAVVCGSTYFYSLFRDTIWTWWYGPMAARGIYTVQIPLSILATTMIALIPTKAKWETAIVYVIAVIVGEFLLIDILAA